MKIAEPNLELVLAADLPADLPGLTTKHARRLQKKIAGAVRQLAKSYARLLAREQRTRAREQHRASQAAVRGLVRQLFAALARPGAAARYLRRPGPAA